jgi:hypothetical protein
LRRSIAYTGRFSADAKLLEGMIETGAATPVEGNDERLR